jgi:hypothetical protein
VRCWGEIGTGRIVEIDTWDREEGSWVLMTRDTWVVLEQVSGYIYSQHVVQTANNPTAVSSLLAGRNRCYQQDSSELNRHEESRKSPNFLPKAMPAPAPTSLRTSSELNNDSMGSRLLHLPLVAPDALLRM